MKTVLPLILLLSISARAQTLFERTWSSDFNSFVSAADTDESGDTYFAVTAYSENFDSSLSIVVKTNSDFEILWSKRLRVLLRDDLACVRVLEDGNIVVGGTMRQNFALDVGGGLVKMDPDGNVIWHKLYSGSYDERTIGVFELSNGDLVSVIRYGVFGQPTRVLTTDASGTPLNDYALFTEDDGVTINAVIAEGETFYATGGLFNPALSRNEMFIMAFNGDGVLWFKTYDTGRSTNGTDIAKGEDGFVITGTIPDPESVLNGTNIALIRTDNEGEVIWAEEFFREGNGFNETGGGCDFEGDGLIRFTQFHITEDGFLPVIAYLNSDGSINTINSIALEEGSSLIDLGALSNGLSLHTGSIPNGNVFLATTDAGGSAACNNEVPQLDVADLPVTTTSVEILTSPVETEPVEPELLVFDFPWEENLLCSAVLATEDKEFNDGISVYPNPVTDKLVLSTTGDLGKIRLTDITGQIVYEQNIRRGETYINLEKFASGVYLLHYTQGSIKEVKRIVKR